MGRRHRCIGGRKMKEEIKYKRIGRVMPKNNLKDYYEAHFFHIIPIFGIVITSFINMVVGFAGETYPIGMSWIILSCFVGLGAIEFILYLEYSEVKYEKWEIKKR